MWNFIQVNVDPPIFNNIPGIRIYAPDHGHWQVWCDAPYSICKGHTSKVYSGQDKMSKPKHIMLIINMTTKRNILRGLLLGAGLVGGYTLLRRRYPSRLTTLNNLNNSVLYQQFNRFNGKQLAQMMTTSTKYRNFIRAHPQLMAKINRAKRNITRQRINNQVAQIATWGQGEWALRPNNIRRVVNIAMARNNHPLSTHQIGQIVMNVMH